MTKKIVAVILAIGVVGWLLAGCDIKGDSCNRAGDTRAHDGYNYTCTTGTDGQNTWQTISGDLGTGTWQYYGHGGK